MDSGNRFQKQKKGPWRLGGRDVRKMHPGGIEGEESGKVRGSSVLRGFKGGNLRGWSQGRILIEYSSAF